MISLRSFGKFDVSSYKKVALKSYKVRNNKRTCVEGLRELLLVVPGGGKDMCFFDDLLIVYSN